MRISLYMLLPVFRYEREINLAQRSILKKICEQDEGPGGYLVLFVSLLDIGAEPSDCGMWLSDGWYQLKASIDPLLQRIIKKGSIELGSKLKISLASLVSEEACEILEADKKGVALKVHGNACRRAKWHVKLGKRSKSTFTVSLCSIESDGGMISAIEVIILRRLPTLCQIEYESGLRKSMSKDEFELFSSSEGNPQTSTATGGVGSDSEERIVAVKMISKIIVGEYCGSPLETSKRGQITFWDSNPELDGKFAEGKHVKIIGLRPGIIKEKVAYLSSTKFTRVVFVSNSADNLGRTLPQMPPPLSVIDMDKLFGQTDCDVAGRLLATSEGHLWLACGDEYFLKLVAIKYSPGVKPPKMTLLTALAAILAWDVTFLYTDPKYGFPVFLFSDHSQLFIGGPKCDDWQLSMIPDHHKCQNALQQALEYVNNLLKKP